MATTPTGIKTAQQAELKMCRRVVSIYCRATGIYQRLRKRHVTMSCTTRHPRHSRMDGSPKTATTTRFLVGVLVLAVPLRLLHHNRVKERGKKTYHRNHHSDREIYALYKTVTVFETMVYSRTEKLAEGSKSYTLKVAEKLRRSR